MRCLAMFVTAVCLLFLLKLKWPKNKSVYDVSTFPGGGDGLGWDRKRIGKAPECSSENIIWAWLEPFRKRACASTADSYLFVILSKSLRAPKSETRIFDLYP